MNNWQEKYKENPRKLLKPHNMKIHHGSGILAVLSQGTNTLEANQEEMYPWGIQRSRCNRYNVNYCNKASEERETVSSSCYTISDYRALANTLDCMILLVTASERNAEHFHCQSQIFRSQDVSFSWRLIPAILPSVFNNATSYICLVIAFLNVFSSFDIYWSLLIISFVFTIYFLLIMVFRL